MNTVLSVIPVGVRFMLLSALGFALMSACVKYVSNYGIPVFEIVAARALVSLVISYLDVKRKRISVWGHNKPLLMLRGAVGTVALMCVYYSVTTPSASGSNHPPIRAPCVYCLTWRAISQRAHSVFDYDLHRALFSGFRCDGSAEHANRLQLRLTAV